MAVVSDWQDRKPGGRGTVCRLGPARDHITEVLRMEQVASDVAAETLSRDGLLLHAGLAVRDGLGFVLAGTSGEGKSTAVRRLESPWQGVCDDNVLVVRDRSGRYWAHAWPTWSRLRDLGLDKSWPVERAVPLRAIFFLKQSASDEAEPIGVTPAAALAMESAVQLPRVLSGTPVGEESRAVCAEYMRAAWALAAAVPAYRLHLSLRGRFWEEMERVADGIRTIQKSETRNQNAELRTRTGDPQRASDAQVKGQRANAKGQSARTQAVYRNLTASGQRGWRETSARLRSSCRTALRITRIPGQDAEGRRGLTADGGRRRSRIDRNPESKTQNPELRTRAYAGGRRTRTNQKPETRNQNAELRTRRGDPQRASDAQVKRQRANVKGQSARTQAVCRNLTASGQRGWRETSARKRSSCRTALRITQIPGQDAEGRGQVLVRFRVGRRTMDKLVSRRRRKSV
jgi:SynChlorMet cassette protein ScmC